MPTNRFVESAFWNFDAMFVPQQHPAREVQDTFYVKGTLSHTRDLEMTSLDPSHALPPPDEAYFARIKKVHESGGFGSIGYRAPFSSEESERLLLRTHTTAISTDMLYQIANQKDGFKPAKLFSIDRVFRFVECRKTLADAQGMRPQMRHILRNFIRWRESWQTTTSHWAILLVRLMAIHLMTLTRSIHARILRQNW